MIVVCAMKKVNEAGFTATALGKIADPNQSGLALSCANIGPDLLNSDLDRLWHCHLPVCMLTAWFVKIRSTILVPKTCILFSYRLWLQWTIWGDTKAGGPVKQLHSSATQRGRAVTMCWVQGNCISSLIFPCLRQLQVPLQTIRLMRV